MVKISKFLPLIILGLIILLVGTLIIMNQTNKSSTTQKPFTESSTVSPTQTPTTPPATASASPTEKTNPSPTQSSTPTINLKASKAIIRTNKGNIELELYQKDAPKTVENFVKNAREGFYNNLTFHRVEDWVIQGGDPKGTGTGGGEMPTELNDKSFIIGSLGVARGGNIQISNDAQFFIVKQNATWLDKQYTNFGIVKSGITVVNSIEIGDKILGISVE